MLAPLCIYVIVLIIRIIIRKKHAIIFYYSCLLAIVFSFHFGGTIALHDSYERFLHFKQLEENSLLSYAKNNLNKYDSMFQIDLKEFATSEDFIAYNNNISHTIDQTEYALTALIASFLIEIISTIITSFF